MLVFAHASHWLTPLIYLAPVIVLAVAVSVQGMRDKRRDGDAEPDGREAPR